MALAGCGGTVHDRFLRIGLQDDFKTLDPSRGYNISTWAFYHMVYDTLVTYDFQSHIVPSLAKGWKIEDGGKRYTFTLQDGVKFHDGRPMTSADVLYSFNRIMQPDSKCPGQTFYSSIVGAEEVLAGKARTVAGITAPDAHTVQIQLKAPNLVFLELIAMPFTSVVPEGAKGDDLAHAPIGTGHFKFVEWKAGQHIKLVRNPDYKGYSLPPVPNAGGTPPDGVEYVLGVGENLEALRFERGDIDLIGGNRAVPAADYAYLAEDPKWQPYMLHTPEASFHYVGMNCRVAPFDKVEVRRAVASAIDKARIVKLINQRGQVAPGILPPSMPGFNPHIKGIPYDPQKARQLLAQAGLPNGFKQTYYSTSSDTEVKIAQSVQQDLAKVGIQLDIKPLALPTFLDAKATPGRVAIAAGNWSQDFPDPSNFLTTMFHSKNIKERESVNDSYYKNPAVDQWLNLGDVETDAKKRMALYDQAEEQIVADAPVVPLYYPLAVQFHAPRVTGYRLHPIWAFELATVGLK